MINYKKTGQVDAFAIGENIRNLLIQRGDTQEQLAEAIEVDPTSVSAWMHGRNQPRVDTLWHISKALNVSVDSLLEGYIA